MSRPQPGLTATQRDGPCYCAVRRPIRASEDPADDDNYCHFLSPSQAHLVHSMVPARLQHEVGHSIKWDIRIVNGSLCPHSTLIWFQSHIHINVSPIASLPPSHIRAIRFILRHLLPHWTIPVLPAARQSHRSVSEERRKRRRFMHMLPGRPFCRLYTQVSYGLGYTWAQRRGHTQLC